jgi:hypothetical protein
MSTFKATKCLTALAAVAGAFAIMLSTQGALAQNNAPAITQAMPTKQVGLWMVNGWNRGNVGSHCSAERPVRGAMSNGGTIQFILVRYPGGYRIALGAEEWELKPQSAFPVELTAAPVMQSDANAIAITPKLVAIDFGADGRFMQRLGTAPMFEVKAANAVFKLPLEGFTEALNEVESCFATLKRAASNPFAPVEGPKTASAK